VISVLFRTKEESPEKRTGVAYKLWMKSAAAGLPLCPLASPTGSTAPRTFLCEVKRCKMWGRFPKVDLKIPTCSASLTNSMGLLSIAIGETTLA
jgi:hypothetical protein